MAGIVGRVALMEVLADAWRQACGGGGQVLVLLGDAGVGKSSVLGWLAERIGRQARTVTCRGEELSLPLSTVADCVSALRSPAISAVGGMPGTDVFQAAEVLRDTLNQTGPTALLIDDIHDADPSSRTAVSLALRRSPVSGVLVVITARSTPAMHRFAEGFRVEQLDGLPIDAAAELLETSSERPVAPEVARKLLEVAAGNPLALTHLPDALSSDQLAGSARLPDELPLVGDLHTVFTRQLPLAGTAAREVLDLAAVSASGTWSVIAELRPGLVVDGVAALEDVGLARLHEGVLTLRHPLLRTAALRAMPQSRWRALNLELAASSATPEHIRLLHRARGTLGPDEELADALTDAAHVQRMLGATAAAAYALDCAVELTESPVRRAQLHMETAGLLAVAGEPLAARYRLEAVLADPSCRDLHVAATVSLATLEAVDGAPAVAWQRLSECAAAASRDDIGILYARMGIPLGMLGLVGDIVQNAETAVELCKPSTPEWVAARLTLAHAACASDEARANHLVDELLGDLQLDGVVEVDPTVGLHLGRALSIAERYSTAVEILTPLSTRLRGEGARTSLAMTFGALGETRVRSSRFDEALVCLDEAIALSLATGQRAFAPFWLSLRARVRAIRGDDRAADDDLALGFSISDELHTFGARYFLLANAGLVALSAGRYADAVAALEECWSFEQSGGLLAPQLARWHADLVEAFVATGRRDEAVPVLAHLTAVADTPGCSRWTRATTLRAQALMCADADPDKALRLADAALQTYDRDVDAFDHARTLRIAAELTPDPELRQVTRMKAQYGFRRVGASAWSAQSPAVESPPGMSGLTDTERRVLIEVSNGLTNRQIANVLQMSSKTVANHLYHVYRKLGVASRTEAARVILLAQG
ncbi:hypothetical protein BA059_02115 [Mycolicibacterium sp. (ex Dasyatis americana)]|nr:hypothetical protein BA059_02115 [Mycolicibacterium sp. (ex Dasyatis americana)]